MIRVKIGRGGSSWTVKRIIATHVGRILASDPAIGPIGVGSEGNEEEPADFFLDRVQSHTCKLENG